MGHCRFFGRWKEGRKEGKVIKCLIFHFSLKTNSFYSHNFSSHVLKRIHFINDFLEFILFILIPDLLYLSYHIILFLCSSEWTFFSFFSISPYLRYIFPIIFSLAIFLFRFLYFLFFSLFRHVMNSRGEVERRFVGRMVKKNTNINFLCCNHLFFSTSFFFFVYLHPRFTLIILILSIIFFLFIFSFIRSLSSSLFLFHHRICSYIPPRVCAYTYTF